MYPNGVIMARDSIFPASMNCQACGSEWLETELNTIKLAGFVSSIFVCETCLSKTAESSFQDAADLLREVVKVAKSDDDPERRLRNIRALIGE